MRTRDFAELGMLAPKDAVEHYLEELLIEFLRAISVQQLGDRHYAINHAFWQTIKALAEVPEADRQDITRNIFVSALSAARDDGNFDSRRDGRLRAVRAAAKVLGEKIGGTATQLNLAEQRFGDQVRYWEEERAENRRRANRGLY